MNKPQRIWGHYLCRTARDLIASCFEGVRHVQGDTVQRNLPLSPESGPTTETSPEDKWRTPVTARPHTVLNGRQLLSQGKRQGPWGPLTLCTHRTGAGGGNDSEHTSGGSEGLVSRLLAIKELAFSFPI